MFKKLLPIALVAIVLGVVFTVLFAAQRMGLRHPDFSSLIRRRADDPVEPAIPEA